MSFFFHTLFERKSMYASVRSILCACLALTSQLSVYGDEPARKEPAPQTSKKTESTHPLLGVVVTSVHPALASNLKDVLSPEQGLTVEFVGEDSPAARAGIKVHDILTAYDDQKLFSAEQLAKLVYSDKVGRAVTLEMLRHGKLHKHQVTLGETDSPRPRAWTPTPEDLYRGRRPERMIPRLRFHAAVTPENFDSMTLKKLGDDKFRAEVQYLDKNGKTQKHTFEGTRDEIRKAIEEHNDLKPAEKAHLLRSLNLHGPLDDISLPDWFFDQSPADVH
jgi:hypothetical protein